MKTLSLRLTVIALISSIFCTAAYSFGKKSSFNGRIVAYRPADRMQVASFAANREILLFGIDATKERLVKLVYVHQGYSDLKGDVLYGRTSISISARRDSSCDQTLASFERDAPAIPIEGGGGAITERIVFTEQPPYPLDAYQLKCYVLDHWGTTRSDTH